MVNKKQEQGEGAHCSEKLTKLIQTWRCGDNETPELTYNMHTTYLEVTDIISL